MIQITAEEIKNLVNLTNLKKDDLITPRIPIIDDNLKNLTNPDDYSAVESGTADDLIIARFKAAFACLMYAELTPFLNTNTAGNGIVKSTGFDSSRTELITDKESDKKRDTAELQALRALKSHLNETGLKRLEKMTFWEELGKVDVDNIEAKAGIINRDVKRTGARMSLI